MANDQQRRVAVVTGSYRGIGYEIVKGLCQKFDGDVYMTARSADKARESVEKLEKLGLKVCFHQLDTDDQDSISQLACFIKDKYGGLDVLVNNAAIYLEVDPTTRKKMSPTEQRSAETIKINYTGTLNVCYALFPLLRSNARVVHISSRLGLLSLIKNKCVREKVANKNLTFQDIDEVNKAFLCSVKNGTWKKDGYPNSSYTISKIGINAATGIQQRAFDQDMRRSGIVVSAMCPGYCKTEMTGGGGVLTAEEGAETAIFLALLPADFKGEKGKLWAEMKLVNFENGSLFSEHISMVKRVLTNKFKIKKRVTETKPLL